MTPAEIIERATEEGVLLSLSTSGSISAKGNQSVIERWLPKIRDSKVEIIATLQLEQLRSKMLSDLRDNPGTGYTIEVIAPDADPVVVLVAILDVASFEMQIPRHSYDEITLQELVAKHSLRVSSK
jgi:hypothetical protein